MSDFETGLIPAVQQSFPQSRHRGCHFHYCQAIYCNVQRLGLANAYETWQDICMQIRTLIAMAFLPLLTNCLTFATLEIQANPLLQPLFQYFCHEWLTVVPPAMWNVYGESLRTNNDCEGWHLCFNNVVNAHHPNIWRFLQCLLEEQALTELM
jgi:hypothetical protein